jgi:hypothetical protein
MTPADVIRLLDDPTELMRKCFLAIAGGSGTPAANGQAVLSTFKIEVLTAKQTAAAKGFTTGISGFFGRQKTRPTVRITKQGQLTNPAPAGYVNAYYIPMVQINDVTNGTSHYTLPTAGATTLCITSRLTGCVFSVGSDANGAVLASHVQPPKGPATTLDARQLQTNTAGTTGFVGPVSQVRHGTNYDLSTDYIAVIGTRTGTRWNFFMQKSQTEGTAYVVRSAVKVV